MIFLSGWKMKAEISVLFLSLTTLPKYAEFPAIILMMDVKTRLPRLMEEYSTYPADSLKASILRISKRLGGDNTRDAIECG